MSDGGPTRRRLRVQRSEADQFPEEWPKSAVQSAFTFVASRPDVSMLPMPKWTGPGDDFEAAQRLAEESSIPTFVYYPFDSWDDPARGWQGPRQWAEPLHRYVLRAEIVAGPSLPVTGGPPDVVPRIVPADGPPASGATRRHLIGHRRPLRRVFQGAGLGRPTADTRDRRYRGHLVRQLEAALPAGRVHIRKAGCWGNGAQANLRRRYVRELDRSAIVLAPAGYGYLTFRHADAWPRGRVVLSEPVHRRLRVPEPARWEAGEVERDLEDPARLREIAATGWHYGHRWTDPARQAAHLADALRARLG